MTKSYKWNSRMLTLIGFIITALSYITVDQVASWLPTEYKILAPTIIGIIGYAAAQFSEEKRVLAAEQLKTEELTADTGI